MRFFLKGVSAVLAVLALTLVGAASASANWEPAGSPSTLSATGLTFQVNSSSVITTCGTSTAKFTPTNPASSSMSAPAGDVTFSKCKTNIPGVTASLTASSGTWTFSVLFAASEGSFFVGVTTPRVQARYTFFGYTCTVTAAPGTSLAGMWTNDAHSLALDGEIAVDGSGGACGGTAQEATVTATYTDQTLSITL